MTYHWPKISVLATALTAAALLCSPCPAQAQGVGPFVREVWQMLVAPNPLMDSLYLFQPAKNWLLSTGYEMARTGVRQDTDVESTQLTRKLRMNTQLSLEDRAAHRVGVRVRYGPLQVGLFKEVGRHEGENQVFTFNWQTTRFWIEMRHSLYSAFPKGSMSFEVPWTSDPAWEGRNSTIPIVATKPAAMKTFQVNGIYAFNWKRFSCLSAYNGRVMQRRSAGSWMVGAKYMQGDLMVSPDEHLMVGLMYGVGHNTTYQLSLGGGYSYNWVLLHRNAVSPTDLRGLRNVTANLTVLPMLTVLNRTETRKYDFSGESQVADYTTEDHALWGQLRPNFVTRAALGCAFGHFYLDLWTDYSRAPYATGARTFDELFGSVTLSQRGVFSTWRVMLDLYYRF